MALTQRNVVSFAAALCLSVAVSVSWARDSDELTARVNRIESQTLVELLTRLDRLQGEVQQLRGQIEEQAYKMDGLQQRQKDIYLELDGRLRKLEQGGVTPPPATGDSSGDTAAGDVATDTGSTPPPPAADDAHVADTEQGAYQQAFDLLKQGQYAKAINRFSDFLGRYPDSPLASNAQYWIGEANYVSRDYDTALVEFRKVIDAYPNSGKVPDAMLKIGFIHAEQGSLEKARATLNQVKTRYPDSSAARLADERLTKLKQ
jgi:tol-pal system protein YbgF